MTFPNNCYVMGRLPTGQYFWWSIDAHWTSDFKDVGCFTESEATTIVRNWNAANRLRDPDEVMIAELKHWN